MTSVAIAKRRPSPCEDAPSCEAVGAPMPTAAAGVVPVIASALLAEQTGRLDQQHDYHDYENDGVRRFRVEHLRQSLDDAEAETGKNRTQYRPHSTDHHDRKHHDDEVRAHLRV